MARSVENDRRDIAAAEEAAQEQAGDAAPEVIERSDVDAVRARLADLKAERKAADDRVQGLLNAKQAATSATERTTNAGRYHREVLAWSKIGDALAPDGIPGEILAEALQPSTTVWRTCPPKRTGRPWQSAPTWRSPTAAAPTGCCRSPSAGASTRS